jgi:TonB family protein
VAALPPAAEPAPDIRSALRRGAGGAGGRGEGRGGIEGAPIPLESRDPRHQDYLEEIRRRIQAKWIFPCVPDAVTGACDYLSAQLVVEFGVAKDGQVPFVNVLRSSGHLIMDEYAVRAVQLASPFPRVPDTISRTGIPIHATFNYVVETSLINLLR